MTGCGLMISTGTLCFSRVAVFRACLHSRTRTRWCGTDCRSCKTWPVQQQQSCYVKADYNAAGTVAESSCIVVSHLIIRVLEDSLCLVAVTMLLRRTLLRSFNQPALQATMVQLRSRSGALPIPELSPLALHAKQSLQSTVHWTGESEHVHRGKSRQSKQHLCVFGVLPDMQQGQPAWINSSSRMRRCRSCLKASGTSGTWLKLTPA
jgi:hypothetical protein